jgi:hypothetical protein
MTRRRRYLEGLPLDLPVADTVWAWMRKVPGLTSWTLCIVWPPGPRSPWAWPSPASCRMGWELEEDTCSETALVGQGRVTLSRSLGGHCSPRSNPAPFGSLKGRLWTTHTLPTRP